MTDLFNVMTIPLKKMAELLLSLTVGDSNLGSLLAIGFLFAVLIMAITHLGNVGGFIKRRMKHGRNGDQS